MAEKKTTKKSTSTKKASKQAKPKAVDMVTPVTPADETGLELTETMVQEPVIDDEQLINTEDPAIVFENNKEIMPKEKFVEQELCEQPPVTDHKEEEVCTPSTMNREFAAPDAIFVKDKEMENDITNILNGISGVKASKVGEKEEEEVVKRVEKKTSPSVNTEEKNYYSERFSEGWNGVSYDY